MRARRDDRGGVAATAIVLPAALSLIFLVLQVGLWFYGRSVATAAAQHGLDAARVESGSEAAGETTVRQFLNELGGGLELTDLRVNRGAEQVTVTVEADPVSILPGFVAVPVEVTLHAPVERVD